MKVHFVCSELLQTDICLIIPTGENAKLLNAGRDHLRWIYGDMSRQPNPHSQNTKTCLKHGTVDFKRLSILLPAGKSRENVNSDGSDHRPENKNSGCSGPKHMDPNGDAPSPASGGGGQESSEPMNLDQNERAPASKQRKEESKGLVDLDQNDDSCSPSPVCVQTEKEFLYLNRLVMYSTSYK